MIFAYWQFENCLIFAFEFAPLQHLKCLRKRHADWLTKNNLLVYLEEKKLNTFIGSAKTTYYCKKFYKCIGDSRRAFKFLKEILNIKYKIGSVRNFCIKGLNFNQLSSNISNM